MAIINVNLPPAQSGGGTTYSPFSGATSIAAGSTGAVPAPAAGDNEKFLRGDGQWATVGGGSGGGGQFTLGTTPSTVEGAIWLEDDS